MNKEESEKLFLEQVKKRISEERKEQIDWLERIPWEYKGRYAEVKWGDEDLVENLSSMCITRIKKLENLESNPYFGSFSFALNGENNQTFRLGKTDINDKTNQLVLDWRNPICTLYYDQSLGNVSYEAPVGTLNGVLTNKSQILINDGEIKSMRDVDLVSDDELLQPYLDVNADNRMKIIIASIQAEQNSIIRKPINNNLIIQGVAGSGKTSVALHRIAYLLYNNNDKNIDESKFVIVGPNKYFLNYISSILPDLDTKNANEYTFEEIGKEIIGESNYHYETSNEDLTRFISSKKGSEQIRKIKGSLQYKECLEKFLQDYFYTALRGGIKFENIELISEDYLKRGILVKQNYAKSLNDFVKLTIQRIKEDAEDKYYDLVKPLTEEMKQYPLRSNERNAVIGRMDKLKEMLKKGCSNELRKFVKPLLINPINLYKLFLENIDKYIQLTPEEINLLKQDSIKLLKKKVIPYEDIAGISFLSILYNGTAGYEKYKHIVIDEAQDYSLFQFDVMKTLFSKSTFSIFGDLAQAIYSYRSISSWEELKNNIFGEKCEILNMLKSYRTTKEITDASNYVLRSLNLSEANPVIRTGENIKIEENDNNREEYYLSKINDYVKKGYKSVGIICKDNKEIQGVKTIFDKLHLPYNYVTSSDIDYNGGISILTSYLAKGLEFDAVIINDASEVKYDSNSEIDMHLLYVAMTRALHELDVMYDTKITDVLSELNNLNKITDKPKQLVRKI